MKTSTALTAIVMVLGVFGNSTVMAGDSSKIIVSGQMDSTFSQITSGDPGRYREDWQLRDKYFGGLTEGSFIGTIGDWQVNSEFMALNEVDLKLSNEFRQEDGRYILQEISYYPKYYDASNRFYDTPPRIYDLETTLQTLRGNISFEMGMSQPGSSDKTFAGYRRRSRSGDTNSYWGAWLRNASPDDFIMFVQPIQRHRNEYADTGYFGAQRQIGEWNVGLQQQIERFNGDDKYDEPGYYNDGTFIFTRRYHNQPQHLSWNTTLDAKRYLLDEKMQLTLSQRMAVIHTDSTTDVDSYTPSGVRHYGEHSLNFVVAEHAGRRYAYTTEVKSDYTPNDGFRFWGNGQLLVAKAVGDSTRGEEGAEAAAVDNNDATVDELWAFKSNNREVGVTEEIGAEVTSLPKTRIALQATMDQNRATYHWLADVSGSRNSGSDGDWLWLSRIWENRNVYSVSIRNWALRRLTLLGRYRYRVDKVDVREKVDVANTKTGDPEYTETDTNVYYPGRIEDTWRGTHEILFSSIWKVHPRLTLTPRFEHRNTHYEVANEPEIQEISSFRSNTVSAGLMAQPTDAVTCTVDLSRQFALTTTRASAVTNTLLSPNTSWYGGLTPSFDSSYTAVNSGIEYQWRDLKFFSDGGVVDGNGDFDTTLVFGSLGVEGPLKKFEDTTWKAAYRYSDYHEDENNGINDYTAYTLFFVVRTQFDLGNRS